VRSTRRRLSGAVLTLTAALAAGSLAGCGGSTDDATTAADTGGKFTDDLGTTVRLDEAPTRVAGLNDVLSSLWNYGIEPVASFGQTSVADDVAFEGEDLSGVEVVGTTYGQIAWRGSAADVIERTAELAGSLGVDLQSEEMAGLRSGFDRASAELTEAAAAGLTELPVAAYADEGFYMAKAPDDPSLRLYSEPGVQFVHPGGSGYFWEVAGWETVSDHPSDVLLHSLRGAMSPEEMATQPAYQLLPAVQAQQVHPWEYLGMDHPAQTAYMEKLAQWLSAGEKVT
jgi:iron complex transport system substrate-binding protein